METLKALARERIASGALPTITTARTWGGPGNGTSCALCDAPIAVHEVEIEVEPSAATPLLYLHVRCFEALLLASREQDAWRR